MSDPIKHECAVALLALRKPRAFFARQYDSPAYGFRKLAILLEKQHNRGQDGAGVASLRCESRPGEPSFRLEKSVAALPLADLLSRIGARFDAGCTDFDGDRYLGHLRYATFGRDDVNACHPFACESPFLNRTLLLAGNFNITNSREVLDFLVRTGHHPASQADGYLIHSLLRHFVEQGLATGSPGCDFAKALRRMAERLDGAFTLCGLSGDGTAFALRDPHGIRPGYVYFNEEVVVVASERPAIQAAFDCATSEVQELPPGKALLVSRDGTVDFADCLEPREKRSCVFERIYFSRPNDADIHRERRRLGQALAPRLLAAVDGNFDDTFFCFIPNSAQVAFHGLLEALSEAAFRVGKRVRFGQIAIKDARFRTFIANAACRRDLFMHVYDITYGLVRPGLDTLVVLDDSIVRGNTMRNAILPMLSRLDPTKILVASSAPPVMYPDGYGIDMATLQELVAFEAAVEIARRQGKANHLKICYARAKAELAEPGTGDTNWLKAFYDAIPEDALTPMIASLLKPADMKAELEVVFQTPADLRRCCPDHTGDWYFTGDYPTPGGHRVANQALVNYMENHNERAY